MQSGGNLLLPSDFQLTYEKRRLFSAHQNSKARRLAGSGCTLNFPQAFPTVLVRSYQDFHFQLHSLGTAKVARLCLHPSEQREVRILSKKKKQTASVPRCGIQTQWIV